MLEFSCVLDFIYFQSILHYPVLTGWFFLDKKYLYKCIFLMFGWWCPVLSCFLVSDIL